MTDITPNGVRELNAVLPKLKITYFDTRPTDLPEPDPPED